MRILILNQYHTTLDSAGSTRSFEFCKRLIAAGHKVRLITSAAFLPYEQSRPFYERKPIDGIDATILRVPYSNDMSFARRMRAFANFALLASLIVLRESADVVFATSTPLTIAIPAIVARYRHRVPMVFEVRDLWPDMPIACGALRHPILIRLARSLERSAYNNASQVVALSPGMASAVKARRKSGQAAAIIPNGCDTELFSPGNTTPIDLTRFGLRLNDNRPLIVYAGAVGLSNGLDYLLHLAAEMRHVAPEARFLIVGDGAEWNRLHATAQQLGILNHNLYISAAIPKREVPALLAAATTATSIFRPVDGVEHNSANKFFDALAAGRPVAINYGGWHADLIRGSQAGIILPVDKPTCGAHQLAEFLADPTKLATAGSAARQLAQRFDRDLLAAQLQEVLLAAVANTGQSRKAHYQTR